MDHMLGKSEKWGETDAVMRLSWDQSHDMGV